MRSAAGPFERGEPMTRASLHNKVARAQTGSSDAGSASSLASPEPSSVLLSPRSTAMVKLKKIALTHNRGRDAGQLQAFQGRDMDTASFRTQWNKAFPHAKITRSEAEAVLPRFDRKKTGVVDGAEFLIEFFTIGFDAKRESARVHRELTEKIHAKVADRAGKGCEIPNFKGSYLGRFPLVSADFSTSDHLSERSRP